MNTEDIIEKLSRLTVAPRLPVSRGAVRPHNNEVPG